MLSVRFVREIHARLAVRYGSAWSAKWLGIDPAAIEADWCDQLSGMTPEAIRKALASLPVDFPPTAAAFRALGHIRHEAAAPLALPAPSNPAAVSAALNAFGGANKETPAEWMDRLDRDVRAGTASPARVEHHRIATANGYYGGGVSAVGGDFTPIRADVLPPGMRPELRVVADERAFAPEGLDA